MSHPPKPDGKDGKDEKLLYFAYGSNMSTPRLRARAPSARAVGIARLPAHAHRWHKIGRDGSGKCDIVHTGCGEDAVWGVLFALSRDDKRALDRAEGLGVGYQEKTVRVETEAGPRAASTYCAKPDQTDPSLRPAAWYKAHVQRGAREHGLPAAYARELDATASPAAAGDATDNADA